MSAARTSSLLLVLSGALLLAVGPAQATPGQLDASFGSGGKVTTAIGSGNAQTNALVLQADGKIVAAGYAVNPNPEFALVRYNANGALDTSFGSGGKVTTAIGSSDYAYAVVLQPNGKIIAAGTSRQGSQYAFALARYNTNGTLDTSFGSGGKVTTAIGSVSDVISALALQPDGKIVAVGESYNGSTSNDFALVRYNANGTLDTSFGSGGKVTTSFGSGADNAYSLALQPDGEIVAAGSSWNGTHTQGKYALARYTANGALDASFGSGGKVTTLIGSWDDAYASCGSRTASSSPPATAGPVRSRYSRSPATTRTAPWTRASVRAARSRPRSAVRTTTSPTRSRCSRTAGS